MKELSIEEKARAYDRALAKAKEYAIDGYLDAVAVNDIFPELKESEDEKIKKWIINDIRYNMNNEPLNNSEYKKNAEKAIAWLEKQAGQKPAEWTEEDEHRLKDTIYFLETAKKHYASTVELDACIDWLKSLRPQNRWKPSKEQIHWLKWAINRMPDTEIANEAEAVLEELLEQLKKLKEGKL